MVRYDMREMKGDSAVPASDPYVSFLIRMQRARSDDRPTWIILMRSTKTGELRWFPNLDSLVTFLQQTYGTGETARNVGKPNEP